MVLPLWQQKVYLRMKLCGALGQYLASLSENAPKAFRLPALAWPPALVSALALALEGQSTKIQSVVTGVVNANTNSQLWFQQLQKRTGNGCPGTEKHQFVHDLHGIAETQ